MFLMVKLRKGKSVRGPSSAIGILRFTDVDTKGPRVSHKLIIGIVVAFIMLEIVIQFF